MNLERVNQKIITREPTTVKYYEEIRDIQPLSYEEERHLLKLAKEGDICARNKIIESQLKFVVAMARRAKTNMNINDLIDEGNIGLIKAIDEYDMENEVRFGSYAVHWINKSIQEYIMNYEKSVTIKNANRLYTYVNKYRNMFFNEYQRYPVDDEEMREYMIEHGIEFPKTQIFNTVIASIDSVDDESNDSESNEMIREAMLSTSNNNVIETVYENDDKAVVKELLSVCSEDERDVISMLYGIGRPEETIASIATIKRMHPAKVKRICKKAIEKMKLKKIK